jgi:predicted ribosome quality control (RQC) complex YloA/Tae2 family protein
MESSQSDHTPSSKRELSPEKAEELRKKGSLLLARTHLLQQLQAAQNPRHRQMVEKALADLEKQLGMKAAHS